MYYLIIIAIFSVSAYGQDRIEINESSVELARVLGKDIFELNGVPFSQPIVTATNATANSGFFNTSTAIHCDMYITKTRDSVKNFNFL